MHTAKIQKQTQVSIFVNHKFQYETELCKDGTNMHIAQLTKSNMDLHTDHTNQNQSRNLSTKMLKYWTIIVAEVKMWLN